MNSHRSESAGEKEDRILDFVPNRNVKQDKPMSENDRQVLLEFYKDRLAEARKDLSRPIRSHELDPDTRAADIGTRYTEKQMKIRGIEREIEKLK